MSGQNQIGLSNSAGYISMNNGGVGLNFNFTTSYQEMTSLGTNFVLAPLAEYFTMTTDGRLKYTGIKTQLFLFDALLQTASSSNAIQLYKNGSPLTGAESYINSASGINVMKFPTLMLTNDYISVYAKRLAAATAGIFQVILSASIANGS